jgi:hypothetical protein
MRVLIVITLLVWAAFALLFVLADVARDLARRSFHAPPDLGGSDDWDFTERRAVARYPVESKRGDDTPGSSTALDDLRSAL